MRPSPHKVVITANDSANTKHLLLKIGSEKVTTLRHGWHIMVTAFPGFHGDQLNAAAAADAAAAAAAAAAVVDGLEGVSDDCNREKMV